MTWITDGWNWNRSIGRRDALESGLDEETRFHLVSRRKRIAAPA